MRNKILFVLPVVILALCGFTKEQGAIPTQPLEERKAQDVLPKSKDPMWVVLGQTKIKSDYAKGLYTATFPDAVKALVGTQVTISGFMLPLESSERFHHFILSKRTPTCPFCPPGEPNEIVDVWTDENVLWDEDVVKVTGKFELMNNAELGLFFKLTNAKKL